jgi:glycosyltransferase involved in cell wall biosynthesis
MVLPKSPSHPRRWLILSHAFNVDGRAESVTITDKMPHLLAAGVQPIVLSGVMGTRDTRFRHEQLLPWGPAGLRFDLRHVLARRWERGMTYRLVMLPLSLMLAPFIALERLLTGLRSQWSWALPAAVRGARLIRRGEVDLVYSTGGVFSAHLAAWWLKRLTGVRWIAEIHDPMLVPGRPVTTRQERCFARLEGRICRDADLAWWFTDGALTAARRRHPELGARGIVVLPGAEPPVVRTAYARGPQFVLGHFGSLSETRSLGPTFQALAALLARRPELRKLVRVEVYGSALDPTAARLRESLALGDVVAPIGRLEFDPQTGLSGRARVMQRMQQLDVLLMLHGTIPDCPEYIPSKLYEYFWARRPVLALSHLNPQLDALVIAHGGWVAPATDAAAVEAALEAAIDRWRTGALPDVTTPPVTVAAAVQRILEAVDHG